MRDTFVTIGNNKYKRMKYDIIIIGGGIVGLATSLKIKEKISRLKILLIEKEDQLAKHQTGNNSGVIHSGIYYKPGSLKALNCIKGYRQLIDFCDKENIKYDLCGKIIIATKKEELSYLDDLFERGKRNGLSKIIKISGDEINQYEPYASGLAAIYVPYTGIVDFSEVANKYGEIFTQRYGGQILLSNKACDISINCKEANVFTNKGIYSSKVVINTSGLYCDKIAALIKKRMDVRIIPFRGEYSELIEGKIHLVRNLIYPVPDPKFPFLGVHFTRTLDGGIEAGPNAVWAFKREGYKKTSFNFVEFWEAFSWPGFIRVMLRYWQMGLGEYYRSYNRAAMIKALQRLVPEIKLKDIQKGGAGVRAQACHRNGKLIDDFLIIEDKHILNVLNAPSPAATASLAIGETIAEKALSKLN